MVERIRAKWRRRRERIRGGSGGIIEGSEMTKKTVGVLSMNLTPS